MSKKLFPFIISVLLLSACNINLPGLSNDDDDDDSPCPDACDKVDDCDLIDDFFSDYDDCMDVCEDGRNESDDGTFEQVINCIMDASCEDVAACYPEDDDDDDGCCSASDPCDWANDGVCDCGGDYSWDDGDCAGDDDDDSSSSDPCSECLSTCSGLSSCCTGCGCICESACNMCF